MDDLRVSPDGYISIGNPNSWYSLDAIQQAVLKAQNPGLRTIDTSPGNDGAGMQTVNLQRNASNNQEQHLPLPSTVRKVTTNNEACGCQKQQPTANAKANEHLPLPSTLRATK